MYPLYDTKRPDTSPIAPNHLTLRLRYLNMACVAKRFQVDLMVLTSSSISPTPAWPDVIDLDFRLAATLNALIAVSPPCFVPSVTPIVVLRVDTRTFIRTPSTASFGKCVCASSDGAFPRHIDYQAAINHLAIIVWYVVAFEFFVAAFLFVAPNFAPMLFERLLERAEVSR